MAPNYDFDFEEKADTRFEEFLHVPDDQRNRLIEWLLSLCKEVETRKRQRKPRDSHAFEVLLSLIVVNALRASGNPKQSQVYYSRKMSAYAGPSAYYPWNVRSRMLRYAVDLLEQLGLLTTTKGQKNLKTGRGRQSTFSATPKLLDALTTLQVNSDEIFIAADAPVLILKDERKNMLRYDWLAEPFRSMVNEVRAVNAFLSQQTFHLPITDTERIVWETGKPLRGEHRSIPAKLENIRLYRVYNNRSWEQGGRFYGGWWQTIPSEWRGKILINGNATVELDFSGFLPRAIYHEEGFEYEEDPYDVPFIREAALRQGMEWETVRASLKILLIALINCDFTDKIERISGLTLPRGKQFTKKRVIQALEEKHARIRHRFRKGWGLKMMNRESNICQQILSQSVEERIAVLPIHDSFIAERRHETWLRGNMTNAYVEEFQRWPVVH